MLQNCCEEKLRLMAEFKKTTNAYASIVAEMASCVGALPHAEFVFINSTANRAREICIAARERFYGHMTEHRCQFWY